MAFLNAKFIKLQFFNKEKIFKIQIKNVFLISKVVHDTVRYMSQVGIKCKI